LNNYEGMFLFDPAVTTDWEQIKAELDRLMARAGARMIACGKWDERRLAYEIRGWKRAVYALTYFEAEPDKIGGLERDVRLSEAVIRCLLMRVDHLSVDEMKQVVAESTQQGAPEVPPAGAVQEQPVAHEGPSEPKAPDETVTAVAVDDAAPSESVPPADSDQPEE
jgi:small subunit ribosomal protein S6